ncbi:MAG: OmpH family outer membrane protein [Prevotella sp.]|nr:OmpH family outer membrane protein [Candidatus Prevotella equi]
MRKFFLTFCLLIATVLGASAQQFGIKVGYFSYDEVLKQMPEYSISQQNLEQLRAQYAAELKAAEGEFNEKYELFLDQQASLAEPIRQKRQADLQALLERNTQFRAEAERLVNQAEKDAMAPIRKKLDDAIQTLGNTQGYLILVNTDSDAVPYFSKNIAQDVTEALIKLTK